MKVFVFLILFITCSVTQTYAGSNAAFKRVRFLYNHDGDTFTVNLNTQYMPDILAKDISVRIRGIDTAEMSSKDSCAKEMALRAKDYTYSLLKASKRTDLINVGRDKYFRLLADVIIYFSQTQKINLGEKLLQRQLALPYDGKEKFKGSWCPFLKHRNP